MKLIAFVLAGIVVVAGCTTNPLLSSLNIPFVTFVESNGLLIMEAKNPEAPDLDLWERVLPGAMPGSRACPCKNGCRDLFC